MEFYPSVPHAYAPVNVGNDNWRMSRKRTLHPTDAPLPKRYLNGALAAELRGLRISGAPVQSQSQPSVRNAFGVSFAPSTFYTPNFNNSNNLSTTFSQYQNGVAFGDDFSRSLQSEPTPFAQKTSEVPQPVVTDPDSSDCSSGSVAMSDVEYEHKQTPKDVSENSVQDVTVEECDEPSSENRLIVYRPPVRTNGNLVSRMNAVLPDSRSILRNRKTDDWMIVARTRPDNAKRKLALVPWEGDPQKKLCDSLRKPRRVIPMPWHDNATSDTIVETIDETADVFDDGMEIEEISQ